MDRLQPLYLHETTFISHNSLKLSSIPTWMAVCKRKRQQQQKLTLLGK